MAAQTCQDKARCGLVCPNIASRKCGTHSVSARGKGTNPFRYFESLAKVIRLVVMMYVRCPLSPQNLEDLLADSGIDIWDETVLLW